MSKIKLVSVTPTITTSAYATGQSIGGVQTLTGLADGGFGIIYSMALGDASGQNTAIDLFLFSQAPTAQVDHATVTLTAADIAKCIAVIPIIASDYASGGTGTSVAAKAGKTNLFIGCSGSVDNHIYGLLVARGSGTYTTTTALTLNIIVETKAD